MSVASLLLCMTVITIVRCDYTISMPDMLEAVNGSCIMIPCQFSIPEFQESNLRFPANGVWRKGSQWFQDSIDLFNSSLKVNKLNGKILGDLTQKNCTSVLYNINSSLSDKYYFRLETGFKLTFEKPVMIRVKDSVPEPFLSHVTVSEKEGTELNITCMAMVPCPEHPPNLTWVPQLGNYTEMIQKQADGTFTLSSVLRFVSSHVHHDQNISCIMDYHLQTSGENSVSQKTATIAVLFSPKVTIHVDPAGPLQKDTHTTIFCSAAANPAVTNLRWFREWGGKVHEVNTTETNLTLIMTSDNVGLYFCEAQNAYGNQTSSTVQLEIQEEYDVSDFVHAASFNWLPLWCGGAAATLVVMGILAFTCIKKRRSMFMQDLNGDSFVYANVDRCTNMKVLCDSREAQRENEICHALYSNVTELYKF